MDNSIRQFIVGTCFPVAALSYDNGLGQNSNTTFTVGGELQATENFSQRTGDLTAYNVKANDRDGREHAFKVIMLRPIPDSAGVTLGKGYAVKTLVNMFLLK